MQTSNSIQKISAALVKALAGMGNAKKEANNPFFKKKYADLNAVREAVMPSLIENGIGVIQPTCVIEGVNYVETILLHESGESISGFTQIVSDKPNDAQRMGSGLSYARRYGLQSMLGIGSEDDDGNRATGKAVAAPSAWEATTQDLDLANALITSSTMDDNKKTIASNSVSNAKSQKDLDKILDKLRTLQPA